MKQLLIETIQVRPSEVNKVTPSGYIAESIGGKLVVTLPATTCDKKNLNERVYSSAVMESVCKSSKTAFENKELLSSVNEHPTEPYVTPGQASHVVTDAWVKDGIFYNKWEVLETATGKDLRALIESGVAFGVSIRGLGSVDYQGNIGSDYEYCGTDCVGEPSAQLRVRPEIVKESFNIKSMSKESKMADKASVLKYLSEQKVLIKSELQENKINAFQRAAAVEAYIAEAQLSGKELADIYKSWEETKGECFATLEESTSGKAEVAQLNTKLLEQRARQIKAMAKGLNQLSEQVKATKVMASKEIMEAKRKLHVRARVAESSFKKAAGDMKALMKENKALKAENAITLAEAAKLKLAYRVAVKEAAKINVAYKIAIKEAARLSKGKKLIVVKEAKQLNESVFTFFTDADYQTFAGAGRPFGKMEPMMAEGNDYQAVLAGTDDGETQLQVFLEDGSMWMKPVDSYSEFYQIASEMPETVGGGYLEENGFIMINEGFGESKVKSFKTKPSKSIKESKVIDNSRKQEVTKEVVVEDAVSRGEHVYRGWI